MSNNQVTPEQLYRQMQSGLTKGWNTWNPRSVLSHVLLPHSLNVQLCIKNPFISGHHYLRDTYISSKQIRPEKITPGLHSFDGSYTSLKLEFEGSVFQIETATEGEQWVMMVTPLQLPWKHPHLVIESGLLFNKQGSVVKVHDHLMARGVDWEFMIGTTGKVLNDFIPSHCAYLSVSIDEPVGFFAGKRLSVNEIVDLIEEKKAAVTSLINKYGTLAEAYEAIHNVISWNIIYDPFNERAIFPVSRCWNEFFGGPFVLFDWDTYFGSYMASMESRELAYANAIAITKHISPTGFIPNYVGGYELGSWDRSQPPIGSKVFLELYRKFSDKWVLEYVFDDLLRWNRWWMTNRSFQGYLCWGSDPLPEPNNGDCDNWQAAAYESGLDNSPMYDGVPFVKEWHLMDLADVGLMSLYIMDCESLALIAVILGRDKEHTELVQRAADYRKTLSTLWCDEEGIFLNKRVSDGVFSKKLSPTLFYPLLTGVVSQEQAMRMVNEHLLNSTRFYGEWMLPSVAKSDPSYSEQDYWRGRIWPPMNYLVYLSLKQAGLSDAKNLLVNKSLDLLMYTWKRNRMVHENYNSMSGFGRNEDEHMNKSDSYYHWGGLLSFISLTEAGFVPNPCDPISA